MILSSMTLCLTLMGSPAIAPAMVAPNLGITPGMEAMFPTEKPRPDERDSLEDCVNRATERYTYASIECYRQRNQQLRYCSTIRDPVRRNSCARKAYLGYQRCAAEAQQRYQEDILDCYTGGGDEPKEPCRTCPQ